MRIPLYLRMDRDKNPFQGIENDINDAVLDRMQIYICRIIATAEREEHLAEVYRFMTMSPPRVVLKMPKPLLDEFWKFINDMIVRVPNSNVAHGLRVLVSSASHLLAQEDEFQANFHKISEDDLNEDYKDALRELGRALHENGEIPAPWAKPLFRGRGGGIEKGKIETPRKDLQEVKTWEEWDKELGSKIIDPDGFRDNPDTHLYTRDEFIERVVKCTRDLTPKKEGGEG